MTIKIKYFGQLRAVTGVDAGEMDVTAGETLQELVIALAQKYGQGFRSMALEENGKSIRPSLIMLVDGRTVDKTVKIPLSAGQEVSLLTAIAGG